MFKRRREKGGEGQQSCVYLEGNLQEGERQQPTTSTCQLEKVMLLFHLIRMEIKLRKWIQTSTYFIRHCSLQILNLEVMIYYLSIIASNN